MCPWNHVDQVCYPECLGFSLISCWDESAGCTTVGLFDCGVKDAKEKKKSGTDHCFFLLDLCI